MKKPYSASYKKAIVVAALILAIIVAGFAVFLSAWKYQVMSSTEKLKNQLYEEYGEYTITLIESIRVLRQWNSFSAEKWTYIDEENNLEFDLSGFFDKDELLRFAESVKLEK